MLIHSRNSQRETFWKFRFINSKWYIVIPIYYHISTDGRLKINQLKQSLLLILIIDYLLISNQSVCQRRMIVKHLLRCFHFSDGSLEASGHFTWPPIPGWSVSMTTVKERWQQLSMLSSAAWFLQWMFQALCSFVDCKGVDKPFRGAAHFVFWDTAAAVYHSSRTLTVKYC